MEGCGPFFRQMRVLDATFMCLSYRPPTFSILLWKQELVFHESLAASLGGCLAVCWPQAALEGWSRRRAEITLLSASWQHLDSPPQQQQALCRAAPKAALHFSPFSEPAVWRPLPHLSQHHGRSIFLSTGLQSGDLLGTQKLQHLCSSNPPSSGPRRMAPGYPSL